MHNDDRSTGDGETPGRTAREPASRDSSQSDDGPQSGDESQSVNGSVPVGVVGVGTMGARHARVYEELPGAELVGVADVDADRAAAVASDHGTRPLDRADLLEAAEAVSVAVPTPYHREAALAAIDAGVDLLIEKPLVADPAEGEELVARADEADVTLQVGHVERFNPAVRTLSRIVDDLDVVAVSAERLGPPPGREMEQGVILDLMIHDLDVLLSLVDDEVSVTGASTARDEQYATATLRTSGDAVARLTASRLTQQKVRRLAVTATDCRVTVDYLGQSVRIHRRSVPEYVERDGTVGYRHESIIEEPTVENGEPLVAELRSFLDAARTGDEPVVTGADGLRAVELADEIQRSAEHDRAAVAPAGGLH